MITTYGLGGTYSNIVTLSPIFRCSEGSHAVYFASVVGPSGKTYLVPYCSVDNPIPTLATLQAMDAARGGSGNL